MEARVMQRTVLLDNKGLTLVEVMISLLVFLLVSLAMMQTALVSIEANATNYLRDEAVSVADMLMTEAKNGSATSAGFDVLHNNVESVTRPVRNIPDPGVTFTITRTENYVNPPKNTAKVVSIAVAWQWRGGAHTHTVTGVVRNPL